MSGIRIRYSIKVIARSSRSGIVGWLGDTLRVRVRAPAERGKANEAVEHLLRNALELPKGGARIISGHSSPRKVVEIIGLSEPEIRRKFSDAVAAD